MPTLADQLRAQWNGDWNAGGIDRAAELARLLSAQGINDLSGIRWGTGTYKETMPAQWNPDTNSFENPVSNEMPGISLNGMGFFGTVNNDGTVSQGAGPYSVDNSFVPQQFGSDGYRIGGSVAGHGNVSYMAVPDGQGGYQIMPQWGSSSDMGTVRDFGKAAAAAVALAYGIPALAESMGGAAAGAAGTAGETGAGIVGASGGAAPAGAASLVQSTPNVWNAIQSGALKGAGWGAVKGIATGQNPLTSALKGALSGGVGGGIGTIGQGALGSMFGADPGSMDIIPNAFGDSADYVSQNVMDNVGSFGGDLGGTLGEPSSWSQYLWQMDPSGGAVSQLGGAELGSFADPGFDWNVPNLGSPSMGLNLGTDVLQNLGSFADPGVNLGSSLFDSLPQASYSNEGRNYSGPNGIDPVGNSPAYTNDVPFIDLTGGGSLGGLGDLIKGAVGGLSNAVGGGSNLGGLLGAIAGAASSQSGTSTTNREPWSAAQPFLKGLLADADGMRADLKQNPYTPQQQAAYGNAYAGLDQARAAIPGLLSWGQGAMQRQSTVPSYEQLFGRGK